MDNKGNTGSYLSKQKLYNSFVKENNKEKKSQLHNDLKQMRNIIANQTRDNKKPTIPNISMKIAKMHVNSGLALMK